MQDEKSLPSPLLHRTGSFLMCIYAGESQAFFGHIAHIARSEQYKRLLVELWLIGHHMVHWRLYSNYF